MHKDKRGIIKDLMVGKDWSVTYITFKKGAVRGNHVHKVTGQLDFCVKGKLKCEDGSILPKGNVRFVQKTIPHAYIALEDSELISVCSGVRIGKNYSKDTYALQTSLFEPSK